MQSYCVNPIPSYVMLTCYKRVLPCCAPPLLAPALPALSLCTCATCVVRDCQYSFSPVCVTVANSVATQSVHCRSPTPALSLCCTRERTRATSASQAQLPVGQRLTAAPSPLWHFPPLPFRATTLPMQCDCFKLIAAIWAESPSVFQWCLLLTIMWFGLSAMQGLMQETDSVISWAGSVRLRMLWCEKTEDCGNVFQRWGFTGEPISPHSIPDCSEWSWMNWKESWAESG